MPPKRIYSENENLMHFLTITVIEWIDIFTKPEYFKVIIDSLNFCQTNKELKIFEFVIMSNHIHLIVRANEGNKLSQIVSDFKKHTTREILKLLANDSRRYILNLLKNSYSRKKDYDLQIWQRKNYPEVITTEKFYQEKANYIHRNPVKKEYVKLPEDWIYSSAGFRVADVECPIKLDYVF